MSTDKHSPIINQNRAKSDLDTKNDDEIKIFIDKEEKKTIKNVPERVKNEGNESLQVVVQKFDHNMFDKFEVWFDLFLKKILDPFIK